MSWAPLAVGGEQLGQAAEASMKVLIVLLKLALLLLGGEVLGLRGGI
ncbi:hypothetical protein AB6Q56_15855 [Dechloromonas sp. ARDL1]